MWRAALLGVVGGAIPEILRFVAALRDNKSPNTKETIASVIVALLGLGVLLFNTTGQNALQIAVLGAAFPSLFTGLVAAAKPPSGGHRNIDAGARSVLDYLTWRF